MKTPHLRAAMVLMGILIASGCGRMRMQARKRAPEATQLLPIADRRTNSRPTNAVRPEPARDDSPSAPTEVAAGSKPVQEEFGAWQTLTRVQPLRPLQLSDGRFKQHPVVQPTVQPRLAPTEPLSAPVQTDLADDTTVAENASQRVELLPPPPIVKPQVAQAKIDQTIVQIGQTGSPKAVVKNAVHERKVSTKPDCVEQALFQQAEMRWKPIRQHQTAPTSPADAAGSQRQWQSIGPVGPDKRAEPDVK